METAIVLLNFGEPATPDREVVLEYLTRIFYDNASLEDAESDAEAWERSRELAGRRLPGLMEEYEEIGGSPLQAQATAQAEALSETLAERGHEVTVYHAMQFMEPLITALPETLAVDEIERVIAVPIYPLCGPSTTVSSMYSLTSCSRVGWIQEMLVRWNSRNSAPSRRSTLAGWTCWSISSRGSITRSPSRRRARMSVSDRIIPIRGVSRGKIPPVGVVARCPIASRRTPDSSSVVTNW